ncbi:hypothetical protein Aperf_G00000046863 [Anoplocephala perfoliata]
MVEYARFSLFGVLVFVVFADATVTYGSVIKLINTDYNVRLHSHDIGYGSGSGQQSVTGIKDVAQKGSYWKVNKENNKDETLRRGEPVKCGQLIRLTHIETNKNLHSHHFQAPLSKNYEVSAFGKDGIGDEGDNWEIICSGGDWTRDSVIKLRHVSTSGYLHVSGNTFQHPIPGQFEVSASTSSYGSSWKAAEGVYIQSVNLSVPSANRYHEEL